MFYVYPNSKECCDLNIFEQLITLLHDITEQLGTEMFQMYAIFIVCMIATVWRNNYVMYVTFL